VAHPTLFFSPAGLVTYISVFSLMLSNRPSGSGELRSPLSGRSWQDGSSRSPRPSKSSSSSQPLRSQRPLPSRRIPESLKHHDSGANDRIDQSRRRHASEEEFSTSSVSSAGSSFLIRMRGGRIGYESSLTSGEDEYEQSKYAGTEVRPLRKRNVGEPRSTQDGKMFFMIVQLSLFLDIDVV
jgi:hypothetical protein